MTEDEMIRFIRTQSAQTVLERLAAIQPKERRQYAKAVQRLFRDNDRPWNMVSDAEQPRLRDADALSVAMLATASLAELIALPFPPIPRKIGIATVLRALQPEWIEAWVEALTAANPHVISQIAPIWQAGLCPRPTSDAYILGYYVPAAWYRGKLDEDMLLEADVWRFFEVEGGGEFSLAAHDKYAQPANTWSHRLLGYSKTGRLDRSRLLDASLDALSRDFGQFRAGWYSRFHAALAPTPAEMAARSDRYLALLRSAVPPTVSFAMKAVQVLDKAGAVAPEDLLAALDPALQARQKGTVTAALRLLASAAKREPGLREAAAQAAVLALVSEDAGVQGKALDLIERLGATDQALRGRLAEYVDLAAPSVRGRIATLAETEAALPVEVNPIAEPVAPEPAMPEPVVPVSSTEEALTLFLTVLEGPRDPVQVELACDGLARFGFTLRAGGNILSPLKKRAAQVLGATGDHDIRRALAATGLALAEGTTVEALWRSGPDGPAYQAIRPNSFAHVLLDRNADIVAQVLKGVELPLLSLPSDRLGRVAPSALVDRLALYQGNEVPQTDLALALLRLSPEGRAQALDRLAPQREADCAVAYALGADIEPGQTSALWAAAWAARQPTRADPRVAGLFEPPLPDCGTPAASSLKVWREESEGGEFAWHVVEVPVEGPVNAETAPALPAMFYPAQRHRHWHESPCGTTFEDVAWAALARPAWQEPFFRQALLSMDTCQKLSDHYCAAYLEPFFRAGPEIGPLGASVLALYMASEDKAVAALAADATVTAMRDGRLDEERFARALKPFLMCNALPTGRWTKGFAAMAEAGAGASVREVIARLLEFPPEETPRDMGAMLELLYELHVADGTVPDRAETLDCLKGMPGGGKVAKFSRKLIRLAG